jgi:hypothetical protein
VYVLVVGGTVKPRRAVVDPRAARRSVLRSCLGRFATGVAVVTFDSEHARHGITINSFTSASLDPPLVLVSVDRRARSHDLLHERAFTVNVLDAEQGGLTRRFAGGSDVDPCGSRATTRRAWPTCSRTWSARRGGPTTAATTRCSSAKSSGSISARATRSPTTPAASPRWPSSCSATWYDESSLLLDLDGRVVATSPANVDERTGVMA